MKGTAEFTRFNALLSAQLADVPDGPPKAAGTELGHYVAAQILDWRKSDGSATPTVVSYTIGSDPGDWQPTPPAYNSVPATPWWPGVTPFALASGSQFRPGPPPELTSPEYTEAYLEVKALGGDGITTPSARTPEQTEIAYFWSGLIPGGSVSNFGVAMWDQIAETVARAHDLPLADTARLFAQLNVTTADAFIAGFDAKYAYNFWRPVTAIRTADTDLNPATVQDATWTPLIPTPNHPSYVALHGTQSRAAAEALAAFFDTDRVGFTATWAGVERAFDKFTAAAKEAGKSRIYGGIHWSFDVAAGEQLGRKVGRYVAGHFFRPLGDSGHRLQAAAVPLAPVHIRLGTDPVQPLLTESLAGWQAADVDTSTLRGVEVRVADLGGRTLGKPAGDVIWLDDAAGWGWFVDLTPGGHTEFAAPSDQGEQGRMVLLTALEHEVGHLLGRENEGSGLMQETLTAGTRRTVTPVEAVNLPDDAFLLLAPGAGGDLTLPGRNGERK